MLEISAQTSLPAMRRLAAHPEITVALFRTTLKPAASTNDDALLDQLVTDLGNEKFAVREAAFRRLDELGERAVVGLRARLANISDAEPRARVMRLLAKHDPTTPTAEVIREARALEILEQINTPEARALLKDLSAGTPSARRTQAAAEALRRMEQ
jgi:HEAT repeat protein